jgi:hypothetical protein
VVVVASAVVMGEVVALWWVFAVEGLVGDAPPEAAGAHDMMSPQPNAAIIVRTTTSVFHLGHNPSVGR